MGRIYKSGIMYSGGGKGVIIEGYYLNGKFYTDSTYTVETIKSKELLYCDISKVEGVQVNKLYFYDGTQYVSVASSSVDPATPSQAGIAKLYNNEGQNIDGAINQKVVTDSIEEITFAIDASDEECLVLDKPW